MQNKDAKKFSRQRSWTTNTSKKYSRQRPCFQKLSSFCRCHQLQWQPAKCPLFCVPKDYFGHLYTLSNFWVAKSILSSHISKSPSKCWTLLLRVLTWEIEKGLQNFATLIILPLILLQAMPFPSPQAGKPCIYVNQSPYRLISLKEKKRAKKLESKNLVVSCSLHLSNSTSSLWALVTSSATSSSAFEARVCEQKDHFKHRLVFGRLVFVLPPRENIK